MNVELDDVALKADKLVGVHGHSTGLPFDLDPLPGQLVQRLPVVLYGREHRRDLIDLATEESQRVLHPGGGHVDHLSLRHHVPIRVAAVRGDAQLDPHLILLV